VQSEAHISNYYYNITVEDCHTIQKINDFLIYSDEKNIADFDFDKLSLFLTQRSAVQMSTISLYILILSKKE
jgi:hypothetical protein